MSWARRVGLGAALWLVVQGAAAHPLAPAALHIRERAARSYTVRLLRPAAASSSVTASLPADCALSPVRDDTREGRRETEYVATCAEPLDGRSVGLTGLVPRTLSGLVLVERSGGLPLRAVLDADSPGVRVPARASLLHTLRDYGTLGVRHLLEGADHVSFVVGLFLLAESGAALLWALSAFTLGHSLTLALSTLSWLSVPSRAAELGIALSVVLLGLELEGRATRRVPARAPRVRGVGFAAACGLLHGLGFAGALRELGFPEGARLACLGAFNVGLELAQLALVLALSLCTTAATQAGLGAVQGVRLRRVAAHAIGALGVWWCLERLG